MNRAHRKKTPAPPSIPVSFRCTTHHGWPLFVAGNVGPLGEWNPDLALPMQLRSSANGGRHWEATLEVRTGERVQFKFIAKTIDGVRWAFGQDRDLQVAPGAVVESEFRQ